jgi:hypothetical protein
MDRLRSVIESEQFKRLCSEISSDVRRLDEQLAGVIWSIAKNAENFTLVAANLYVVETFMPVECGDYVFIYYTIDGEDTCTLRWIEAGSSIVDSNETTLVPMP